jgi:hypothetical protein
MVKLRALTHYLTERLAMPPEQLSSRVEQVTLRLYWKPTDMGLHMGDLHYDAGITIDRFADTPARLMALLGSWLEVNDPGREQHDLAAPTVALNRIEADLADIDIQLNVVEALHLSESDDGEIEAFGKRWALAPFDLWIAEAGGVTDDSLGH